MIKRLKNNLNPLNSSIILFSLSILIIACQAGSPYKQSSTPNASFTFSPALPTVGQAVQFTDTSTGSPTSWSWNFGDGSTSTAENPSHTFASAGYYTVSLTVSNSSGSNSTSQTITVTTAIMASFTFSPALPTVGQAVQFTDTSTGSPTSWSWNFGDGAISYIQNPSHAYARSGAFSVTLTIWSGEISATHGCAIIVESGSAYWVSSIGAASWASSYSSTPLSGAACCSLATANANAQAGDTVLLRGGTYTLNSGGIAPSGSGTDASHRIIFAAYPGESPVLTSGSPGQDYYGIDLEGNSYILVTGFSFINFGRFIYGAGGIHHVEISYCDFHSTTGENVIQGIWIWEYDSSGGYTGTFHDIWIHNNIIYNAHENGQTNCTEGDDLIRLGATVSGLHSHNNTVENNLIFHGGHVCFDKYTQYDVVKNNFFHNEPWIVDFSDGACTWPSTYDSPYSQYNGHFGHRCEQITRISGDTDENAWTLVEGNRYCFGSVNPNNDGADCLDVASASNIIRFNDIYQAMNNGVLAKYPQSWTNSFIFNTVYYNGYGYAWKYGSSSCPNNVCPDDMAGFSFGEAATAGSSQYGWLIANNIFYQNNSYYYHSGRDIIQRMGGAPQAGHGTITNNWLTSMGDPQFVDETVDITNAADQTTPNFDLQTGSPCIGAGSSIDTAQNSGSSSTTLVVGNAQSFQDGTWGADMTHGVTLFPDQIAIGTVSNIVAISSINYSTNTITLASPTTWSSGAPIWLYTNSSGQRVLYGTAPDLGAHPFVR